MVVCNGTSKVLPRVTTKRSLNIEIGTLTFKLLWLILKVLLLCCRRFRLYTEPLKLMLILSVFSILESSVFNFLLISLKNNPDILVIVLYVSSLIVEPNPTLVGPLSGGAKLLN